ncbi:MAG: hypothetical protein EBE86_020300 [Hormoscilla sp. GUM202]|nr:hypothetical protein [Hormoscilla sp. GUM202]
MTPEVILCQLTIEQIVAQIFARHCISSLDRQLLTSPLRSGADLNEREHTLINLVLDGLQSGLLKVVD